MILERSTHWYTDRANAWLQLDLGSSKPIGQVKIWNIQEWNPFGPLPTAEVQARLGNHQIWVGDSSTNPETMCFEGTAPSTAGPFEESCAATGRYVRIVQAGRTSVLNLAEVEVTTCPC
jgi:hypothetical protein